MKKCGLAVDLSPEGINETVYLIECEGIDTAYPLTTKGGVVSECLQRLGYATHPPSIFPRTLIHLIDKQCNMPVLSVSWEKDTLDWVLETPCGPYDVKDANVSAARADSYTWVVLDSPVGPELAIESELGVDKMMEGIWFQGFWYSGWYHELG